MKTSTHGPSRTFLCAHRCLGAALLAAALTLSPSGCAMKAANRVKIEGADSVKLGALAVDIDLPRGSVEIFEDSTVKAPDVIILRTDGAGPGNLDKIESYIACQLVPGDFGSVLRIVTADTARGEAPPVLLKIRVPTCDGLRVRTGEGCVTAVGVGGTIDIETASQSRSTGFVNVETERALNQSIRISTRSGDINVSMPASSDLAATAQTEKGWAKLTAATARVVMGPTRSVRGLSATIGKGGSPMDLASADGNIHVKVN